MSKDVTVPKITEFLQNFRDINSRAHIASHICCCPLQRPHYAFSDHQLQIMVLNKLHPHGSIARKTPSVLPGAVSPHVWSCKCRTWWLLWWSRGNSSPSWWLWNWGGLPLWTPPSPSWKGDLLVIFLRLSTAQWMYPVIKRGIAGGHGQFTLAQSPAWDLWWAVRAHCHLGLQAQHGDDAEFPHLKELVGEECVASPSPVVGFKCHTEINVATCASNGAIVQTVIASSCNSITSIKVWLARFKSSIVPKRMTDSATEYWSTPNGWVWLFWTQIPTMFSSKMEEASIEVPSPLVMESKHNLSWNDLEDGTSWSLDVVVEEFYRHCGGEIYLYLT